MTKPAAANTDTFSGEIVSLWPAVGVASQTPWMTPEEAAIYLRLDPDKGEAVVRRMIRENKIPFHPIGVQKHVRLHKADLDRWMMQRGLSADDIENGLMGESDA